MAGAFLEVSLGLACALLSQWMWRLGAHGGQVSARDVGATLARRTELLQLGEEPGMFPLALGLVGTRCGVTRRSEECIWHRDQRVLIMMGGGKREEEGERGRGERLRR